MNGSGTSQFRWLPFSGRRHAIDDAIEPNTSGRTLCGKPVPKVPAQWDKQAGCWETCWDCDYIWRCRENIPLNPAVSRSKLTKVAPELTP
ncbi:hypothetical protein F0L68_35570 [Solihabitans fulvus]|uniref:Zinc-finger n=1 Tax=Solihabitans fulvus TaxID=1892852 RepID=A0A5B2WJW8_9PSEU|nr:hypothetical protein F0L68_35570 [Solihabitans fulvus]